MYSFQQSAGVRIAVGSASLALLVMACYWTVRLSRASHLKRQQTADSLARATRVLPDDAALWMEYSAVADPEEAAQALERAVVLNPAAWTAWIRLGSRAEAAGHFARAEYCYRQAAVANRQFQPAWSLANYFFRRGNRQEFDLWAGRALRMSYGDPRPIFELCWRSEEKADLVLRAAAGRPDLLRLYLAYLTAEGKLDGANETARQLLPLAREEDLPALVAYCGRVLETGTASGALEVWNELCRRRMLPHAALAPGRGLSVTNGDFAVPPSSLGFDWRIVPWTGISVILVSNPACLRVTFSSEQPERCQVLTQLLPVEPGKAYRLAYDYRTPGVQAETGLRWRVYAVSNNAELSEAPPQLSSQGWERQEVRFSTGPDCRLARLVLVYERAPDTTRIEGSLWLRHISLD
jgi:tetratricopeptide (TPR) repeat protein